MTKPMTEPWHSCPGSVIGVHDARRNGRCRWCGVRCESPVPAPEQTPRSEANLAYRYHYDPDFGAGRWDVYE